MLKFLGGGGGVTFIQGTTSIPDSRVYLFIVFKKKILPIASKFLCCKMNHSHSPFIQASPFIRELSVDGTKIDKLGPILFE